MFAWRNTLKRKMSFNAESLTCLCLSDIYFNLSSNPLRTGPAAQFEGFTDMFSVLLL